MADDAVPAETTTLPPQEPPPPVFTQNDSLPRRVSNAVIFAESGLYNTVGRPLGAPYRLPTVDTVTARLHQNPAAIRDGVRELVAAVRDQIEALRERNDPATRDFIDFLEFVAKKLGEIAEAIDTALSAPPDKQQMFFGTAGQLVEQLKIGLIEYVEKHRTEIAGYSFKGVFAITALKVLALAGFDAETVIKLIDMILKR
jgi:hypothetical protein